MKLSRQAESLLDAMARDHGLKKLALDQDGLIPINLGPDLDIAIAFSEANNSFYLMGILDVQGAAALDPWWAFTHNQTLSDRRTRVAIEPTSGSLVLVRDLFLNGLEYWQFSETLDQFVGDLEAAIGLLRTEAATEEAAPDPSDPMQAPADDAVILRL